MILSNKTIFHQTIMAEHPHLANITFEEPDTKEKYEERTINLVCSILEFADKNWIESFHNYYLILESLMTYDETFTKDYLRDIMFFVSCSLFPNIADFMLECCLYTKQTLTTFYSDKVSTPLEQAIRKNHVQLVERFAQIGYFGKLLVLCSPNADPPIFLIQAENHQMMKIILESKYCTKKTLKTQNGTYTVFGHYLRYDMQFIVRELLKSEKCTTEHIISSNQNDLNNIMCKNCFELILESNKLPMDFFVNNPPTFYGLEANINSFLNSQYCTVDIVEKFINESCLKVKNVDAYNSALEYILSHPKYSHLKEKYNMDGSVKNEFKQKDELNAINVINERFEEMSNIIKSLQCEIQILGLRIDKMELEKNMSTLK